MYTIIYETNDGKAHRVTSPDHWWDKRPFRTAHDNLMHLRDRDDVIRGHIYDEVNKKAYCSFDKEDL